MRWGFLTALFCLFTLIFLVGCGDDPLLVPDGGYDYRVSGDYILGYPIPLVEDNPMCISVSAEHNTLPPAFTYREAQMQYYRVQTAETSLTLPGGGTLSVPSVGNGDDRVFFEAVSADGICVFEGAFSGYAVAADGNGNTLFLSDETECLVLTETLGACHAVLTEKNRVLYTEENGDLYEYRGSGKTVCLVSGETVTDAWYAKGTESLTVVYETVSGNWYTKIGTDAARECVLPENTALEQKWGCVFLRDTVFALAGTDDRCYFYDLRTGEPIDMDMGGLYRFKENGYAVDALTVSPDGIFVYLYDVDFIYRMNLQSGTLDLAYNEAPMFENTCIINSMTAVTDEIVILSQEAAEHTEFSATITIAVFEEDIPELRHEDERIDMEHHTVYEETED